VPRISVPPLGVHRVISMFIYPPNLGRVQANAAQ
jgi:hypothetical protein